MYASFCYFLGCTGPSFWLGPPLPCFTVLSNGALLPLDMSGDVVLATEYFGLKFACVAPACFCFTMAMLLGDLTILTAEAAPLRIGESVYFSASDTY